MNWIQPVAVHLIGAGRDDLAYPRDVDEGGAFAPEATILVLNEAHVYIETVGIRDDLKGFVFGTSRGRRADRLPHVPGDRHHCVFGEWRHAGARAGDGGARKPTHDHALGPHAGTAHARKGPLFSLFRQGKYR